jgi:hypothetical protein
MDPFHCNIISIFDISQEKETTPSGACKKDEPEPEAPVQKDGG